MSPFNLQMVTAEHEILSRDVDLMVVPGIEGEMTILSRHAPLLTQVKPGEIRVRSGEEEWLIAISGGFLEVGGNRAVILADAAERAEEIDISRAEAALKRAQERLEHRGEHVDLGRALAALSRAEARVRTYRRYSQRTGVPGHRS